MKNMLMRKYFILFFALIVLSGCSSVTGGVKSFLGISVAHLQEARIDADTKTYVCSKANCFNTVLSLARDKDGLEPETEKLFDTFMVKPKKGILVVMGIEGNVDTTEVGIFFTTDGSHMTKIEITSLSSSAQRKVADAVFTELGLHYSEKKHF